MCQLFFLKSEMALFSAIVIRQVELTKKCQKNVKLYPAHLKKIKNLL